MDFYRAGQVVLEFEKEKGGLAHVRFTGECKRAFSSQY